MTFTDTVTVVSVSSQNLMGPTMGTTASGPATITITVRLSSTGSTFTFTDLETNANQYTVGGTFPLQIGGSLTTPTAAATTPAA